MLARPHWEGEPTQEDLRTLTREDVNPYGTYPLDMDTRLVLDQHATGILPLVTRRLGSPHAGPPPGRSSHREIHDRDRLKACPLFG
jgi:hypothetical protein